MEGNFILRYRCFDLFSKVSGTDPETPVWAECYGGQFRVYSTKEFPGLRASTDLTKVRCSSLAPTRHTFRTTYITASRHALLILVCQHLSYFGVRLNLRETERKRRKKVEDPLMAMATASRQKGKRKQEEPQEDTSYDD